MIKTAIEQAADKNYADFKTTITDVLNQKLTDNISAVIQDEKTKIFKKEK